MAVQPAPASENPVKPLHEYSKQEHRPLRAYATISATYAAVVAGLFVGGRAAGLRAPERIAPGDILLIGVATHKVSRIIAKDKITSFVRAPFTRFQGAAGHGELEEEPRGEGFQMALGELALCPYCLASWVATAFAAGFVASPSTTRLVAATFTAETVSDFLQMAYHRAGQEG